MLRHPVLFSAAVLLSCILWPVIIGMVLGVLAVFALKAIRLCQTHPIPPPEGRELWVRNGFGTLSSPENHQKQLGPVRIELTTKGL